jgi:hypothetical protein
MYWEGRKRARSGDWNNRAEESSGARKARRAGRGTAVDSGGGAVEVGYWLTETCVHGAGTVGVDNG